MSKISQGQLSILFASQQRQPTVIDVTPKLAEEWLDKRNDKNRSVSEPHVAMLARAMTEKRFRLTHQGIAFDKSGRLIDGQHRLNAVVKSACTVRMMVTFGADFEDMAVCDRPRMRNARDALSIYNERVNSGIRASTIRMLLSIVNGTLKADDQEILNQDVKHDRALTWFVDNAGKTLWFAPFAAAVVYAYERKPAEVATFVEMVNGGANLPARSGALLAYNLMRGSRTGRGGRTARYTAFCKMLRAIAAHCAGESMTKLQEGEEGLRYFAKFPAAV